MYIDHILSAYYSPDEVGDNTWYVIPNTKAIEWFFARKVDDSVQDAAPKGGGLLFSGTLYTLDPNIAETLFDTTKFGEASGARLKFTFDTSQGEVTKIFHQVMFCTLGGLTSEGRFKSLGTEQGEPAPPVQVITFAIAAAHDKRPSQMIETEGP